MAFTFDPIAPAPQATPTAFSFEPPPEPGPNPDIPQVSPEGNVSFPPMARAGSQPFSYATPDPTETSFDSLMRKATDLPKTIGNAFASTLAAPVQELGHQLVGVGHFLDSTWTGQKILDVGTELENSSRAYIGARTEAIQNRIFDPTDELLATVGQSVGTGIPALVGGSAGAPAAATALIGYATGQMARNQALDAGMTEWQSLKHEIWQGGIEGLTEMLPMKTLFTVATPAKKFLKTLLQESYSEQIATILQSWENKEVMNPTQSYGDWWPQLLKEIAMTAAAVPLTVGVQSGTVSLVEKAAQTKAAYDALAAKEQERTTTSAVKAAQATKTRDLLKQLLTDAATEGDQEQKESISVYHGSPSGQVDSFDDSQVGTRNLGPDQPAGANGGRPAGHFTSEAKGFASMFTQGPGSMEDVKEVPDLPTSTVDVSPPPQMLDVRKFLADNAPESQPLLPEPPIAQQVGAHAKAIDSVLAPIYQKWGSWQVGDLNIHVLDGSHQVPGELVDRAKKQGFDFGTTGAFYDGANSIYIHADQFAKPEDAIPYLYHETLGHFGMEKVVPNWSQIAPSILQNASKAMPESFAHVRQAYANETPTIQAKEILAHWIQNNPTATNSWFDQVYAGLRNWTRSMGFNLQVTRNDVVDLLRKSREGVESGVFKTRRGMPNAILASRSEWDPSVRRWGEAMLGHTNFDIFEKADHLNLDSRETEKGFNRFVVQTIPGTERAIMSPSGRRSVTMSNYGVWDTQEKAWAWQQEGEPDEDMAQQQAGRLNNDFNPRVELKTGKPFMARVYHGTMRGDIDRFSAKQLGGATGADSAMFGHYFGGSRHTSNAYAGEEWYSPEDASGYNVVEGAIPEDADAIVAALEAREGLVMQYGPDGYYLAQKEGGPAINKGHYDSSQQARDAIRFRALEVIDKLSLKEQIKLANELLGHEVRFTAPVTIPAYIVAKNPYVTDWQGMLFNDRPWVRTLEAAVKGGHDVVVFKKVVDPVEDNHFVVLQGYENQVRSVNAKFDANEIKSPDLLAARGKVNTVKINPTTYLDLEKPLTEQSKKVQDALIAAGITPSSITGQEFYDALVKREGGRKQASEWLAAHGIPGATYREAFRPKGQKEQLVRNYITFSGKDMAVLSLQAQNILAEEKARQQSVMKSLIEERMKTPPELTLKKKIQLLSKAIKMPIDTATAMRDEATVWNKFLEYGTGIEEIAAVNPGLEPVQIYTANVRKLWGLKGSWSTGANEQVRRWRKHVKPGQQSEDFDTLMREAGILSTSLERVLTPQEIQGILKDHNLKTLKADEIKFAHDVWADYRRAFDALGKAVISDINATIQNEEDRNAKIKEVTDTIAKASNSNYFPKSNFGEWTVEFKARRALDYGGRTYKEGETVYYSTHTSQDNQDKAVKALQKSEFPATEFKEVRHKLLSSRTMEFMGLPPSFMSTLLSRAEEAGMASHEVDTLQDELAKLEQEHSPVSRLMKKVLRDSNAFGYDENSQRVYANFMQRFANQIAKITYGPNMQMAINSLGEVTGDNTKRDGVRKYLRDHRSYIMNPGNELSWLRGFGFNFYIGLVAKSALVNMTQPALVSLPWLSKRYSSLSATKALALNMDAYFAKMKGGYRFSAEKTAMFNELVARGDLNESFANELAAVAEGATFEDMTGIGNNFTRNADRAWRATTDKLSFLFHHAEGINRYITAGAAYDLAIKAGKSQEEAINEAMLSVKRTQGEYARYNRPKAAWGKKSALFLFMRFTSHMLFLMGYDSSKYRIMFAWLLAAGLLGMPFMENALDLVDALGTQWRKKMGYKEPMVQSREDLLRFLDNIRSDVGPLGDFLPSPDLVMHGMSRAVPLPFTDETADVSTSLSLGRPIPGTEEIMTGKLGDGLVRSLGAVAEMPIGVYNALTTDNVDAWKVIESMMPMSVRNVSAATRWAVRGDETNASGQPIKEFDPEQDIGVIIAKGLGFTPTDLNRIRELDYMQKNTQQFYEGWKKEILGRAYAAYMRGNETDQRIARDEVADFNKRIPYPEMSITADTFIQSITGKERMAVLQRLGYPSQTAPYARLYKDMEEVHERATK